MANLLSKGVVIKKSMSAIGAEGVEQIDSYFPGCDSQLV